MARKKKKTEAAVGFQSGAHGSPRQRLTPNDIQQRVFRLAFRGYHEHDVDEFLDQVTEDLAAMYQENKRLREQLQELGGAGPIDLQEAEERAESIVRDAREHASRLVAEAEQRAAEAAAGAAAHVVSSAEETTRPPSWYLLREREFLERLAVLVKEHAEDLKRQARQQPESAEAPAEGASATPVAQPAPEPRADERGPEDASSQSPPAPEERSVPEQDEVVVVRDEPQEPPEATAPMSAVEADEEDLLREWESSFESQEGSEPDEWAERNRRQDDSSLKELFWGEE